MKQITLSIPENKYMFFMELVRSLGFLKVEDEREVSKDEVLHDIAEGLNEVKLMQQGKLQKKNIEDLLNEL